MEEAERQEKMASEGLYESPEGGASLRLHQQRSAEPTEHQRVTMGLSSDTGTLINLPVVACFNPNMVITADVTGFWSAAFSQKATAEQEIRLARRGPKAPG